MANYLPSDSKTNTAIPGVIAYLPIKMASKTVIGNIAKYISPLAVSETKIEEAIT